MNQDFKLGLVLAGGGGKGAYQVGVWKALTELKISDKITHISGTSIGALNAALFAQGDYSKISEAWNNINISEVLKLTDATTQALQAKQKDYNSQNNKNYLSDVFSDSITNPNSPIAKLIESSIGDLDSPGIFSMQGLKLLIEKSLNYKELQKSKYDVYACSYNMEKEKSKYFNLSNLNNNTITKVLLSSSAIPGIFPSQNIDGVNYLDGAVTDNVPIFPLFEKGVKNFIVIHLSETSQIPRHLFPNSKFQELYPSEDLGGVLDGTLNFTNKKIRFLINLGYSDALKFFN